MALKKAVITTNYKSNAEILEKIFALENRTIGKPEGYDLYILRTFVDDHPFDIKGSIQMIKSHAVKCHSNGQNIATL